MKKSILPLLLVTAPLFAGEVAPVMAPAPSPCDYPPGWTLGLEVLGLQPYQSEGNYDGDMDAGYRASLGYQFSDGLFTRLSGFGYDTDMEATNDEDADVGVTVGLVDLVVGQTFGHCDKLNLSPYVGLCWAKFEEQYSYDGESDDWSNDFDGFGIVVGIDATRALGNSFSLYGKAKQSMVFGQTEAGYDDQDIDETDNVVFISEVGLGIQYDFAFSNVAANVRLGVEGQWWSGASDDDSEDLGLAGVVLGANFRF